MLTDDNKAAYQQSPFFGPLLQPQRGENDDHFNPVLKLLFCYCFHGMVSCVFFLFTSHGSRRCEASATLQRVFIRTGPAYVCVSCSSPYLRPGGDADLWGRAVRCGVIDDTESIEVLKTLGVRKCAVREGEDANGTVLGWCWPCYSACRPPARKRRGAQCHSILHPLVKTDAAASSVPGPACLRFLWVPEKRGVQARLPPSDLETVCPACRTAAELRSRAFRHPPTRVSASVGGVSVPPAGTSAIQQGDLPGISVAPNASSVEGLMHAHLRRTRPEKITTVLSNGRTRTYVRISTAIKSVVGPRHGRRRRAMAVEAVPRITQADPSAAAAAISTIQSQAKSRGGSAVAPWSSLSVREQLQSKVSNRIIGVTCGRFRALVEAGGKSLASLQALRVEAAAASSAPHHSVTTSDQGAFLLSPRAAVQSRLDDLVANGEFLECPVREPDCLSEDAGSASDASRGWDSASTDSNDVEVSQVSDVPIAVPEQGPPPGHPGGYQDGDLPLGGPHPTDWSALDFLGSAALLSTTPEASPAAAASMACQMASHDAPAADESAGGGGGRESGTSADGGGATAGSSRGVQGAGDDAAAAPADADPAKPPVQLCFGMDKGGRTSTVKAFLGIANQRHPASVGHSIFLGVLPCKTDDHAALEAICDVWLADIEELRANGVQVRGEPRTVLVILTGDYKWMTAFAGYSGAFAGMPCLWCTAVARPTAKNAAMVKHFGCI